ncbi:MAG TPA: HU family DNA-binding protein, partial [Acidimicrobiales bacterium]
MNKKELAAAIAERTGREKRDVEALLNEFVATVTDTVATGEPVVLTGFAKFIRVQRGPRLARNPQTGAPVKVPAKKAARITPLKAFKDAVITGKPAKKAARKAPAKNAPAKKTAAKKAPAKKAPAKKTVAKKAPAKKAPAKKAVAKKAPAKKAPAKKAPAKKAPTEKRLTKSPFGARWLASQEKMLQHERGVYLHQAENLEAEAKSLVADFEGGDTQFDEESGE